MGGIGSLVLQAYLVLSLVFPVVHCRNQTHMPDDTWAVIVNASKFWLNYRHTANAMAIYHSLKRLGLPDSRIILMQADCAICDPRTYRPGKTFYRPGDVILEDLYSDDVEIDYRDKDVTAESVIRVLTGNTEHGASSGQMLGSSSSSNVLVYLTGHGGDSFLKFHDQTELMASDLGAAIEYMKMVDRFKNLFVILDTCQASTMYEDIGVRGWAGASSSKRDQSSYALNSDPRVGTFLIDEFSHHMYEFLKSMEKANLNPTFEDMFQYIRSKRMSSDLQFDGSKYGEKGPALPRDIPVRDFFANSHTSAKSSMHHAPNQGQWDATLSYKTRAIT